MNSLSEYPVFWDRVVAICRSQ